MPKADGESYIEYRKRMVDSMSPSFCAAKWYNATIWLGSGSTASCHHPPAHRIDKNELKKNPKALHNTRHKKLMRKLMLKGERPEECDYCWKIEDIKRDNVSDRVFKTVIYEDEDVKACNNWQDDIDLKTLEIAFDANCNFACSYCNPSFSTKWQRDVKENGAYQNLVSDGAAAFQQDGSWAQPYKKNEDNPYIQAFWEWWPELSQSLTELRITGGEPLMSPDVWRLFDEFEKHGYEMNFAVNSNLGAKPQLIDKLVEKSHHLKNFSLYTSCEAVGAQAEYIRDGMDYEYWKSNVEKLLDNGKLTGGLHVMMTINSLCLFSITDFMDQLLEWKEKYGRDSLMWTANILRFPSFMSPLPLPDHILDACRIQIQEWLEARKDSLMVEMEYESVKRLLDYLEVVDNPHRFTSGIESRHRDLKSFYLQYDQRRGKDIYSVFPKIFTDWLSDIPDTKQLLKQRLVDGDSTNYWKNNKKLKEIAKKEGWCLKPQNANPGAKDYKK